MMTVGALRLIFFFIYLCLATAAAVCDARTNRCPNALAFALALSSSVLVLFPFPNAHSFIASFLPRCSCCC